MASWEFVGITGSTSTGGRVLPGPVKLLSAPRTFRQRQVTSCRDPEPSGQEARSLQPGDGELTRHQLVFTDRSRLVPGPLTWQLMANICHEYLTVAVDSYLWQVTASCIRGNMLIHPEGHMFELLMLITRLLTSRAIRMLNLDSIPLFISR